MEKLNIAEILKDCPKGMELDCTNYSGVVTFEKIIDNAAYPIKIEVKCGDEYFTHTLTKYGQTCKTPYNKCIIFPKGKTTWEGFHRPFKDGDILAYQCPNYTNPSIYIHKYSQNLNTAFYVALGGDGTFRVGNKVTKSLYGNNSSARFATEEEKKKLFDAIKENGYKWNPETKTLEKLIVPKFKVGDRIKSKNILTNYLNDNHIFTITEISLGRYWSNLLAIEYIENQDDWELVPNKFDISTLKPFESRVLVRTNNKWVAAFYSHYDKEAHLHYCVVGGLWYKQCIPYESNEHLLGTTDDCDDYFKTWE